MTLPIDPNDVLAVESNFDTLSTNYLDYSAMFSTIRPINEGSDFVSPENCSQLNDILWEYRRDATTLPLVIALFAILYIIIILFGVIGNMCVILAIARIKSLQTVPNMFIFSLSCSDVVVCCTSATITPITAFKKEWLFGGFLCSVAPFIAGASLCFSTFTLAAISLDRFILIRFPMKKAFTHTQAFLLICLICVLAMGLSMPIVFMQTLRPLEKYCGMFCFEDWGPNQSQRRVYGTVMLMLQFVIPLSVIIFCYTAISLRLNQSVIIKGKKQPNKCYDWQLTISDQQKLAMKRRQRTNRMFIGMVVAFSLSWIWTLLYNLLRDYDILPEFVRTQEFFFGIVTHAIAMTSTVWNPILYALLNLQLRAAFIQLMPAFIKKLFSYFCCHNNNNNNNNKSDKMNGETRTRLLSDNNNCTANGQQNPYQVKKSRNIPQTILTQMYSQDGNSPPEFCVLTNVTELLPFTENYEEENENFNKEFPLLTSNISDNTTTTKKYGSFDVFLNNNKTIISEKSCSYFNNKNNKKIFTEELALFRQTNNSQAVKLDERNIEYPIGNTFTSFTNSKTNNFEITTANDSCDGNANMRYTAKELLQNWRNAYDARELDFRERRRKRRRNSAVAAIPETLLQKWDRKKYFKRSFGNGKYKRRTSEARSLSREGAIERRNYETDSCRERLEIWKRFDSPKRLRSASLISPHDQQQLFRQFTLPTKP